MMFTNSHSFLRIALGFHNPNHAAALVCALAERGAGVVGLTAQTKSLEDIFLSLTQTSGEVA